MNTILTKEQALAVLSQAGISYNKIWKLANRKIGNSGSIDDVINYLLTLPQFHDVPRSGVLANFADALNAIEQGTQSVNVYQWVSQYLTIMNLKAVDALMDSEKMNKVMADALRQGHKFPKDHIVTVLDDVSIAEKKEDIEKLLRVREGGTPRIIPFITGGSALDDEYQAAFEHFIWQIKRKLADLPVDYHLMIILHGKQEGGKTSFLEGLLEVLPKWLWGSYRLSDLQDERAIPGIAERYLQFYDEMEGATKIEIENLKNHITAKERFFRPMGTNKSVGIKNRGTCIGASNLKLADLINDDTGMRRFLQINCADRLDWDSINQINWSHVWRSVDHTKPSPIMPFRDRVKALQKQPHSVDAWLAAGIDIEPIMASADDPEHYMGTARYSANALHKCYREWCFSNRYKNPVSHNEFTGAMVDRGWINIHPKNKSILIAPETEDTP